MVNQSAAYAMAGVVPGILGNKHPSIAPYEVFDTADRPMALAVGNDRQFAKLCGALDLPADPRFATNPDRVEHREELVSVLSGRFATRTAAAWFDLLTPLGVPCGPVNDLAGAFDLATTLGLRPTERLDDLTVVANPIHLSRTPPEYRRRPPKLGEHNEELG